MKHSMICLQNLLSYGSNQYTSIAEALRISKIVIQTLPHKCCFFIGDPALKLAWSKPKIRLTKVNDVPCKSGDRRF
jgi:hypothetical protein